MRADRGSSSPILAIVFTIIALVGVNVAIAYLIARAIGVRGLEWPLVIPVAFGVAGILAAIAAIVLFRSYVEGRRRDFRQAGL